MTASCQNPFFVIKEIFIHSSENVHEPTRARLLLSARLCLPGDRAVGVDEPHAPPEHCVARPARDVRVVVVADLRRNISLMSRGRAI